MKTTKHCLLSLLLILCFSAIYSQSPSWSLVLGSGGMRSWVTTQEGPMWRSTPRWFPTGYCGLGLDLDQEWPVAFFPEIGMELTKFEYQWFDISGFPRKVDCRLISLSTRISPGVRFSVGRYLRLRTAMTLQFATGTWGYYHSEIRPLFDPWTVLDITNQFSRIRTTMNIGPELSIGLAIKLGRTGQLTPRLSSYLALFPEISRASATPHQPHLARLSIEIAYSFPTKTGGTK